MNNKINNEKNNYLDALLPFSMVSVTLQFLTNVTLLPFHQPDLSAFLRTLLSAIDPNANNAMERYWTIDTQEAPKIQYKRDDYYRFSLICLKGGASLLEQLLVQLSNIEHSPALFDKKMPFRNNLKLIAVHDLFSLKEIQFINQLTCYDATQLQQEVEQWQDQSILLRWLSPVRLLKDKLINENNKHTGENRYCKETADLPPSLLLSRLYHSLQSLCKHEYPEMPYAPILDNQCTTDYAHFFWFDCQYRGKEANINMMGGLSGEMRLDKNSFDPEWLPWLVLGQYIGIGQRRSFGWGRYQLLTLEGLTTFQRPFSAQPLLSALLEPTVLRLAFDKIKVHAHSHDSYNDEHHIDPIEKLQPMVEQLLAGSYQPPALYPVTLERIGKKTRELAVPPFWDRVLQRAVHDILSPIAEQLYYPKSFGYRLGRSRINAKDSILSLYHKGFEWVVESDIEDFFNNVDRKRLFTRLNCIFHYPSLLKALKLWADAPLILDGQLQQRAFGLALGSPLSPFFANILLDDFDNDMKIQGYQLIRFADDFLIMCRSETQANEALHYANQSLTEHGLKLKESKTKITKLEHGVRFLGYLFMNDVVLDVGSEPVIEPVKKKFTGLNVELIKESITEQAYLKQPIIAIAEEEKSNISLNTVHSPYRRSTMK